MFVFCKTHCRLIMAEGGDKDKIWKHSTSKPVVAKKGETAKTETTNPEYVPGVSRI
jgi:hypothetical protein